MPYKAIVAIAKRIASDKCCRPYSYSQVPFGFREPILTHFRGFGGITRDQLANSKLSQDPGEAKGGDKSSSLGAKHQQFYTKGPVSTRTLRPQTALGTFPRMLRLAWAPGALKQHGSFFSACPDFCTSNHCSSLHFKESWHLLQPVELLYPACTC